MITTVVNISYKVALHLFTLFHTSTLFHQHTSYQRCVHIGPCEFLLREIKEIKIQRNLLRFNTAIKQ